jgi:hypothetical protein
MKAEYRENGTIAVSGAARKQTFNRVWAGIGWPEQDAGYLCVIGDRPDDKYHALWERRGGLWELGDAALEAKDRLLAECIWVDARDDLATSYLRTREGLCFYENAEIPLRPAEPSFAVHGASPGEVKPTATVVPVPEKVLSNYRSALEKTRGLIMAGRLIVHERNCPRLVYTLRQPLEDLLASPVMKGLVWVLSALEDTRGNGALNGMEPDPWYANIPRRGE